PEAGRLRAFRGGDPAAGDVCESAPRARGQGRQRCSVKSLPPPNKILVVDDDEGLLFLMADALRADGYDVTVADSAEAAKAEVKRRTPDLLILDLKLRDA